MPWSAFLHAVDRRLKSARSCRHCPPWSGVVWDRRTYDKVAPFERWAVAVTAHLEPSDRLDAMREVVPPGLMGRHALSHIDFLDHFSGHLPPGPGLDGLRSWVRCGSGREDQRQ